MRTREQIHTFYQSHVIDDCAAQDEDRFSAEWNAYYEGLLNAGCTDFDMRDQASAMMDGLTPAEAAPDIIDQYRQGCIDAKIAERDDAQYLDFDYSMNR